MNLKQGANGIRAELGNLQYEMRAAYSSYGKRMRYLGGVPEITSGREGSHGDSSYHYVGYALDFSIEGLSLSDQRLLITNMGDDLGELYDIVLESDHVHVEFDVARAFRRGYKKEF